MDTFEPIFHFLNLDQEAYGGVWIKDPVADQWSGSTFQCIQIHITDLIAQIFQKFTICMRSFTDASTLNASLLYMQASSKCLVTCTVYIPVQRWVEVLVFCVLFPNLRARVAKMLVMREVLIFLKDSEISEPVVVLMISLLFFPVLRIYNSDPT